MSQDGVTRRLAAILAADVVGYSRLMGADEAGTLAQLKALRRELIDPGIDAHNGRIFKTTGDGIMIEFPSAVDAVEHAVEAQRAMARRNTAVPQDRRIEFRIGINVGDVIVDEGDVFGDGWPGSNVRWWGIRFMAAKKIGWTSTTNFCTPGVSAFDIPAAVKCFG